MTAKGAKQMEEKRTDLQQLGSRIRDNILDAVKGDEEEKALEDLKRRVIVSLLFAVPLVILGWVTPEKPWTLALEIALLIPVIIVNHRVFIDGITAFHSRKPEKNTLAAIGTIAALAMVQLEAAGIFLATMALCRWSEAYVNCKLDEHLKTLIEAEPEDPQIEEGTTITVRRGEIIPADGEIISGTTVVKEELITGERVPTNKKKGDAVFAGTKNLAARIEMRVSRCGQETTISRIIDHITESIATRPPISDRAEKAARILVFAVILLALFSAGIWIASGKHWTEAIMTGVTILIIASPYAFSVGIPMSILGATVRGAKNGILIRSADILELARDINMIAMNKTGTVTAGRPQISDIMRLADGFSLQLAGALEKDATHPIGIEIHKAARKKYETLPEAEDVTFVPGRGLSGKIDGKQYYAGNEMFMQECGISTSLPETEHLFTQGKSVVYYANESRVIGVIALRDGPKPVSLKAISRIEGMGIDAVMLTGDSRLTAEAIRDEVGIDRVYAQIRPEEKARVIEELREDDAKLVAMVGDGIDDAQAIAKADIGIAIGTGPEIRLQTADVILIADDLMDVVRAIGLSRKTIRYIRQNLAFAYCYNVLAVIAAATVFVPMIGPAFAPAAAALCMCASQLIVVASTMRLKTTRL